MLVEVEEDDFNVTFAFDDNAFNGFVCLIQVSSATLPTQGNPLEEVNVEISNVTLAGDDGALLFAHKIIYITYSLFFKYFLWIGIS